MTFSILLSSLILGVNTWYTAPAPPDSSELSEVLSENPLEVLVFMARSGWSPDWLDKGFLSMSLLEKYPSDTAVILWAASMLDVPFKTEMTPLLIEYGDEYTVPDQEAVADDPSLLSAFLRRIRHVIAAGGEPLELENTVDLIIASWSFLPGDAKALSLEVLGKLGIDITGDINFEELRNSDMRAVARYFSELGKVYEYHQDTIGFTLDLIYTASASSPDMAVSMLSDPLWAVRYNAVISSDPAMLESVLEDSTPYVALTAAIARNNSGYIDGQTLISELALFDGPVGHMAAEELTAVDTLLLRELMIHPDPGRRSAAQTAWFSDSLPVDSLTEELWLSDPYWLVPVSLAWHLVDISDSLHAEDILQSMIARRESYTDPAMIDQYTAVLQNRLDGVENEVNPADSRWIPYDLPFDVEASISDTVIIGTDAGDLLIFLWEDTAPLACRSFLYLAESGFYDGIKFHRVIPGFVAQAGCPEGVGTGGPGYVLPNERSIKHFGRGVLGMADSGLNTAGSQFFIMLDSHGRLDGRYTAFGSVLNPEFLDEITVGTTINDIVICGSLAE